LFQHFKCANVVVCIFCQIGSNRIKLVAFDIFCKENFHTTPFYPAQFVYKKSEFAVIIFFIHII